MNLKSNEVIIFTDGSSRGNPGPGGFGAIVIYEDKVMELGGREEHTTNNRMELTAAIKALEFFSRSTFDVLSFTIFSDSSYLVNGITKWIFGWQKNGWKTKAKEPVENQDLWQSLSELVSGKSIEWKLVGGHVGVAGNERCDEIATQFADGIKPNLYNGPIEKYPIKNILNISFDISNEIKKKNNNGRSRAAAYSYISMINGVIKIHKTWAECEARVKGQSGAKYKKALSLEEEKEIIGGWKKKNLPSEQV